MIADPFQNADPLWQPFDPNASANSDFSQPDLTPRSLKEWLRSDEVQKAIATAQPPAAVRQRTWRLPNIPTFPR
jgi:hypothetical protein